MIIAEAAALGAVAWVVTQALFVGLKREYLEYHALFFITITAVVFLAIVQDTFSVGHAAMAVILAETWRTTMVLLSSATMRMLIISQRKY